MSGAEELRARLDGTILAKLRESNPLYYEDAADELTDALLPLVVAYGREYAAAALEEAAEDDDCCPRNRKWLRARAAALKGSEEGTT